MGAFNFDMLKRTMPDRIDSVMERREMQADPFRVDSETLSEAHKAWDGLYDFRKTCRRNAEYAYGDQWCDVINVEGKWMRERDYIISQGKIPLQNNRIASIVQSILGQFSQMRTEPVVTARSRDKQELSDMLSTTIQYVYQRNDLWELDRRALEYLIICGLAVFKSRYGWNDNEDLDDVWIDLISGYRIFFDSNLEDPRHLDISLIGEIHDMSYIDVLSQFSAGRPDRIARIQEIYGRKKSEHYSDGSQSLDGRRLRNMDFFQSINQNRCRVIEVWRKESKERYRCHDTATGELYKIEVEDIDKVRLINEQRTVEQLAMGVPENALRLIKTTWFVDRYWYYRFLSPSGDILSEGESPYEHRSHPYAIKIHRFMDGIVRSFISDVIDQQKYINRLITMQEFVQSSAAKGVLLMPDETLPPGVTMDDVMHQFGRPNGVIRYNAKAGYKPEQLVTNASNTGYYQMLDMHMRMMSDVSGVSNALQGQKAGSGTPASLYAMQTQNSSLLLIDILESFRSLREKRDNMSLKLILQYYKRPRYIDVVGVSSRDSVSVYDPERVRNVSFDLALSESSSTPVARAVQNDILMQLLQLGGIDVKTMLEVGQFAFADKLIAAIDRAQAEAEEKSAQMQAQQQVAGAPEQQGGVDMQQAQGAAIDALSQMSPEEQKNAIAESMSMLQGSNDSLRSRA